MKKLDQISIDLFNKIRGRFQDVTIGDENGQVTNVPEDARFFDFAYVAEGTDLGKVSVALDAEKGISVIVGRDLVHGQVESIQDGWYNFLKELRVFAKKRLLNFEVRDINKSNLNKRDYQFLAQNRNGENTMAESKMYGSDRTSFQKVGKAKIAIKHSAPINVESASSRTSKIAKIFIETPEGEKFKFPYKHLAGARAMALHVSEGGHAFDDFGKYITSLSEEMHKIRKLNTYMGRSTVMAETLDQYSDILKTRVSEVRKEISNLQKPAYYKEAVENFVASEAVEVPDEVAENWIDQLTIKQFNEELKDVFPYVYKLIGEGTKADEITPDDLLDESGLQYYTGVKKHGKEYMKKAAQAGREGASQEELGRLKDKYSKAEKKKESVEEEFEEAMDTLMGQFAEAPESEAGAEVFHDGTTIYPKVGDKVEVFYTSTDEKPDNAVGIIVGQGEGRQQWKVKFKDNETGQVVTNTYSSHDEFYILDDDRDNPDRIKDREQGELPMPGGQTNRRNVKDPAGQEEGNAYAHKVRQAKMNGKKKGDEIDGPDGEKITLEKQKTPIGEFILSYFDRENGTFPKGETAVLTMVEKDYGEQYVKPAAQFMQQAEAMCKRRKKVKAMDSRYPETDRIKELAGLN